MSVESLKMILRLLYRSIASLMIIRSRIRFIKSIKLL